MALILCIETTSKTCSVALSENGGCIGLKEHTNEQFTHAENLSSFIEQSLQNNQRDFSDLDALCVSGGPGSYTGLRIGTATAKGICYGSSIPLITLNTLDIMSHAMIGERPDFELYCPLVDARRMEVFTTVHNKDLKAQISSGPMILDENSFGEFLSEKKTLFFGSGAKKFSEIQNHENASFYLDFQNSAKHICTLAEASFQKQDFVDLAYYEPNYLKPFVATVPKAKLV